MKNKYIWIFAIVHSLHASQQPPYSISILFVCCLCFDCIWRPQTKQLHALLQLRKNFQIEHVWDDRRVLTIPSPNLPCAFYFFLSRIQFAFHIDYNVSVTIKYCLNQSHESQFSSICYTEEIVIAWNFMERQTNKREIQEKRDTELADSVNEN